MIRALAIVLAILLGVIVWQRGSVWKSDAAAAAAIAARDDANTKLSAAKAEIGELGSTIAIERGNVRAANALAARYEQERKHAQDESDRLVDDLRAGQRQLHQRWEAALHTAELSQ
ncbi:MAG TPA: lysis system i-spanin subunit Rz, partial [Variovorax sp.]|nr:lysis system i-spanin subunit Rz [Variovorax sp.]